ncbi:MAG: hypothetical protein H6606_08745 [Flavobacteriales bacterium]|nr:hypothetical protein [Flavobacteriales bacterium]
MNRKFILLWLITIGHARAFGQSSVQTTIQLLTPDLVSSVILDTDKPFLDWMKSQSAALQKIASDIDGNADIQVLYSIKPKGIPTVSIHSRPALSKEQLKNIHGLLDYKGAPNTRFSNFDFVIIARVNDGLPKETKFEPPLVYPFEVELETFEKQDLLTKRKLLTLYIADEVMPLLIHYTATVDEQFLGVRWMSRFMSDSAYVTAGLDSILYNKPEFWRSMMEMEAGNQLILFSAMCMHLLRNEFDRAERLNFLIGMFSNDNTLPSILMDQIQPRVTSLNTDLNARIERGLQFHDEGAYAIADSIYSSLLISEMFPNSAWLKYEKYFTAAATLEPETSDSLWYASRKAIYACDPLYPMDIRARNGREAYLMMRRQSIQHLFADPDGYRKDFVKYADIALDLQAYSFAAQLYWIILSHFQKEDYDDRNMLAYYLYALDKLGVPSIREFFEMNYEEEFSRIESERDKLMRESGIFQAFGR